MLIFYVKIIILSKIPESLVLSRFYTNFSLNKIQIMKTDTLSFLTEITASVIAKAKSIILLRKSCIFSLKLEQPQNISNYNSL